jgi:YD repeat-containing protein
MFAPLKRFAALLLCALTWFAASPALSQIPSPYPVFPSQDANGVDVATGDYYYSQTDVVIGDVSNGGLTFTRHYQSGQKVSSTHNHIGYLSSSGNTCSVVIGVSVTTFTGSNNNGCYSTSWIHQQQSGATLTQSSAGYSFVAADGTVAAFTKPSNGQIIPGAAYLVSIKRPNGETINYGYEFSDPICYDEYCSSGWASYGRLWSVSNNLGYKLIIEYAGPPEQTQQPSRVTGINAAVESCVGWNCAHAWPYATYTYSSGNLGPSSATNAAGQTTSFVYGQSAPSGRLLTDIGLADQRHIIIGYTSGYGANKVTSVNRGYGAWAYSYSDTGTERTTTVSNPDNSTRLYKSILASGRISHVTDERSQTTEYSYDAAARQTKVKMPLGNAVEYTYDSRGNIIQTRVIPKSGATQADLIAEAAYPSSCSTQTQATCNKPVWTSDVRGFRTDYTYDAAHGGVLTITAPAPSGAPPIGTGTRPQTRFTYAQPPVNIKNGSGWLTMAVPVWRLSSTSTCAASASCTGMAEETRTTWTYAGTGVASNAMPLATTVSSGNAAVAATTSITYTNWGDIQTLDGPLPGSADTTRFYYNAVRQVIGVAGPSPDGIAPHRAVRTTYNAVGQPTAVERGTVSSQSDSAFSTFILLEKQDTVYDAYARPVQSRLWGGSSITALTQRSFDNRGRLICTAQRMNPGAFTSPPVDACAQSSPNADRITQNVYDNAGQLLQALSGVGTMLAQTTAARAHCWVSAAERDGARAAGRPIPPLVTWNEAAPPNSTADTAKTVGAAVILYWIISETSRLFPPRNLIPIP